MNKKLINVLESVVILAIFLVLIQTFLEDFAVLTGWKMRFRQQLMITGFFFDLFFTIEFIIRLYYAIANRKAFVYLTSERGWIDFLASIPLLMLNSGPLAFSIFFGGSAFLGLGGMLNLLKVIKAIRIARILRFLRIIKIFRRIKNTDSPMAQRHVANITAIGVTVLVFSLLIFTFLTGSLEVKGLDTFIFSHQEAIAAQLSSQQENKTALAASLNILKETEESLLIVKISGKAVYSRFDNGYYEQNFGPGEYSYFSEGSFEAFFDLRPYVQQLSRESLLFFVIVVFVVLSFLFIYSPHFALTISDPIHVMRRGLQEEDYNLEVKIPEKYQDDDVYQLARLYNEKYLPLKARNQGDENSLPLDLELADIKDILGEDDK
ncbi:MAG TPA: ion transporter [Spirochaetales bacterium]|nr:ion transporter [Spirochaetales bacterium]